MDPDLRRAIALVVALRNGRDATSVYDHDAGRSFGFAGSVEGESVWVFDRSRNVELTGSGSVLLDRAHHVHVTLTVREGRFSGFDHGCDRRFSGTVDGGSISIFDHADARDHRYTV